MDLIFILAFPTLGLFLLLDFFTIENSPHRTESKSFMPSWPTPHCGQENPGFVISEDAFGPRLTAGSTSNYLTLISVPISTVQLSPTAKQHRHEPAPGPSEPQQAVSLRHLPLTLFSGDVRFVPVFGSVLDKLHLGSCLGAVVYRRRKQDVRGMLC